MQKLKGLESVGHASQRNNPTVFSSGQAHGGPSMKNYSTDVRNYQNADQVTWEPSDVDYIDSGDIEKQEQVTNSVSDKNEQNVNLPSDEGQTALHVAVKKGHLEMVRLLLEGGANINKPDVKGCTPKSLAKQHGNKTMYDLLLNHENRRNEHKIEFIEPETTNSTPTSRYLPNNRDPCCSTSFASSSSSHPDGKVKKSLRRVTIHRNFQKTISEKQLPKLIVLPDSIEELLIIAGTLYIINYNTFK